MWMPLTALLRFSAYPSLLQLSNKCSAVAEMGDRLATIDMGRKEEEAPVSLLGELGPYLTQCGLVRGLPPYQVAS